MILTDSAVTYLQDVLDYVSTHTNEWDQAVYGVRSDCGTSGCVAGHLLIKYGEDLGYRPLWEPIGTDELREEMQVAEQDNALYLRAVDAFSGKLLEPGHGAARLLGVTRGTAGGVICDWLFTASNTLQNLWFYGQLLAEGRLSVPADIEPAAAGREYGCDWLAELEGIDQWLPEWRLIADLEHLAELDQALDQDLALDL